jgi:hypothetical protein
MKTSWLNLLIGYNKYTFCVFEDFFKHICVISMKSLSMFYETIRNGILLIRNRKNKYGFWQC